MFEKEAEEIANKRCHEIMCFGHCSFSSPKHHRCGEWHREYNCAKEGIEFGYNKANEWYLLKDGYPEADKLVRVRTFSGKEHVCEVTYYYPTEDEIGYGHAIKSFYELDGEWIDDNDVKSWCELQPVPKEFE